MYTKPCFAPMARAAITMPSRTACGSLSMMLRSMNAPGSPSSALQTTMGSTPRWMAACRHVAHLTPVGKPPPPRPRRPESLISWMICSGVISPSAFASAAYPSRAM